MAHCRADLVLLEIREPGLVCLGVRPHDGRGRAGRVGLGAQPQHLPRALALPPSPMPPGRCLAVADALECQQRQVRLVVARQRVGDDDAKRRGCGRLQGWGGGRRQYRG